MQRPIIITCFHCGNKVHQFEDNRFGCEGCRVVWTYDEVSIPHGWISNRDKKEEKQTGYPLTPNNRNQGQKKI